MNHINDMRMQLSVLEKKRPLIKKEIDTLPEGTLSVENRKQGSMFFHMQKTNGKYVRKSITRNPDFITKLARKKYLETELSLIDNNLSVIKQFLQKYEDLSPHHIIELLPRQYRHLDLRCFLPELPRTDAWEKEPYEKSTYKPECLLHTTSRGLRVRSKSELIIAEKLYEFKLPFRYEQVLTVGDRQLVPDFVIKSDSDLLYYWEHCGMTNNKAYLLHHKEKLELYEKIDIVPWKNLIVTYDSSNGTVNTTVIENEIKTRLKTTLCSIPF